MNSINCKGSLLSLNIPLVMGILNVTPDSFYDGGSLENIDDISKRVDQMITEGVDIIDVGGMSSRPGAELVSLELELKRIIPVIKHISSVYPKTIISIDTIHSKIAQAAISAGAKMVNDISGGNNDPEIWNVCIENRVPYILMHMQGVPKSMQDNPSYGDVVLDILTELKDKIYKLRSRGLIDIIVDPGFGFGKSVAHNYEILNKLSSFSIFGCPILVGLSRKSMIWKILDTNPKGALNGTTATHMIALQNGAKILRVHDVKEAKECVKIFQQISK